MRHSDGAKYPGCPVHTTTDEDEHSHVLPMPSVFGVESGFSHLPRPIAREHSTRWRAPGVRLCPRTFVGALKREGDGFILIIFG